MRLLEFAIYLDLDFFHLKYNTFKTLQNLFPLPLRNIPKFFRKFFLDLVSCSIKMLFDLPKGLFYSLSTSSIDKIFAGIPLKNTIGN